MAGDPSAAIRRTAHAFVMCVVLGQDQRQLLSNCLKQVALGYKSYEWQNLFHLLLRNAPLDRARQTLCWYSFHLEDITWQLQNNKECAKVALLITSQA